MSVPAAAEASEVEVRLSFLGSLATRMKTRGEVFTLPRPVSVRDVVERIIAAHGEDVCDLFYNQYGWLDPRVMFAVDGESVVSRRGLETPLTGAEEIDVFLALPMSGG